MRNKKEMRTDEFSVTFGGKSSIDRKLRLKLEESVEFLVNEGGKLVNIESGDVTLSDGSSGLEIKEKTQNKKREFTIRFILVAKHPQTTLEPVNFAGKILDIVLNWIEIKQHLKGSREKYRLDLDNNKSVVENKYREKKTFSTLAVKQFFANSMVDRSIAKLFSNGIYILVLQEGQETKTIPIENFLGKNRIVIQGKLCNIYLLIKKPDLLGKSMWDFKIERKHLHSLRMELAGRELTWNSNLSSNINGQLIISAKIGDDVFLDEIHDGKELKAGLGIDCDLIIDYKINDAGDSIPKYTVKTVRRTR